MFLLIAAIIVFLPTEAWHKYFFYSALLFNKEGKSSSFQSGTFFQAYLPIVLFTGSISGPDCLTLIFWNYQIKIILSWKATEKLIFLKYVGKL